MVVVSLAAATICFLNACYPALVGHSTPSGSFTLQVRETAQDGYGGDVLQFHDTGSEVYAVHRVWLLRPAQRRAERLAGTDPAQRLITSGCINVSNEVYEKLKKCCVATTLIIQ